MEDFEFLRMGASYFIEWQTSFIVFRSKVIHVDDSYAF